MNKNIDIFYKNVHTFMYTYTLLYPLQNINPIFQGIKNEPYSESESNKENSPVFKDL